MKEEMAEFPRGPTCLMGDINADPEDITSLQLMLDDEEWTDLGAKADRWQ
jgi:hypothetical protein